MATALSLILAAYTYYDNAQQQRTLASESAMLQKELAASSIYQEHMKLSIEHPELANAAIAPKPPKGNSPPNRDEDKGAYNQYIKEKEAYERYQWYVGHALFSFETILDIFPNDPKWRETFEGFIKGHREYILSDFPCDRYTDKLNALVTKTLGKECSKQPQPNNGMHPTAIQRTSHARDARSSEVPRGG